MKEGRIWKKGKEERVGKGVVLNFFKVKKFKMKGLVGKKLFKRR